MKKVKEVPALKQSSIVIKVVGEDVRVNWIGMTTPEIIFFLERAKSMVMLDIEGVKRSLIKDAK